MFIISEGSSVAPWSKSSTGFWRKSSVEVRRTNSILPRHDFLHGRGKALERDCVLRFHNHSEDSGEQ